MAHPLPGDKIGDRTVIASVTYNDDSPGLETYTMILLNPSTPYFMVVLTEEGKLHEFWHSAVFENIVPAVEEYKRCGGDY